jgi:hypothetical protein
VSSISLRAAAGPQFAITATNVTMPATGQGKTTYTATAIPMTGTLAVTCAYSGPTTNAHIPNCGGGPLIAMSVQAGGTATGSITIYPYGVAVPLATDQESARNAVPAAGVALAGCLALGLSFRRRPRLFLFLLAGVACPGISSCSGGAFNGMTPGTYQYTVTAGNGSTVNNAMIGTSATFTVTVP